VSVDATNEEGENRNGKHVVTHDANGAYHNDEFTVTWENWHYYQEDSTGRERQAALRQRRRYATSKSAKRNDLRGEEKRREENKKRIRTPIAPTAFDGFWSAYPRKVGKGAARKAWGKIKPAAELVERMLSTLTWQRTSEQWTKDGGKFIPYPATWLNQERWTDEPPVDSSKRTPDDPKAHWKSQAQYLEAMVAGRVSPKERVAEWEHK
jgi:hypothetical protein